MESQIGLQEEIALSTNYVDNLQYFSDLYFFDKINPFNDKAINKRRICAQGS